MSRIDVRPFAPLTAEHPLVEADSPHRCPYCGKGFAVGDVVCLVPEDRAVDGAATVAAWPAHWGCYTQTATVQPEDPIETINDFMVGVLADDLVIMAWQRRIPRAQALRLAAYLVALGDDSLEHAQFTKVLAAIENT